jgi:hypothetical protein
MRCLKGWPNLLMVGNVDDVSPPTLLVSLQYSSVRIALDRSQYNCNSKPLHVIVGASYRSIVENVSKLGV